MKTNVPTVYLFDYEDSYTYNIRADFYQYLGILPQVVPLKDHQSILKNIFLEKNSSTPLAIVFGPGPGKPSDYKNEFSLIKKLIGTNVSLIGICLGHQMLASVQGMKVVKSKNPKHGLQERIELNLFWRKYLRTNLRKLDVQRYNSLTIQESNSMKKKASRLLWSTDGEVMIVMDKNIFSMQFHPESVGTEQGKLLFRAINRFIKRNHTNKN